MKIKAALLDDDDQFCDLAKMLSKKLNSNDKHRLELHTFTRSEELLKGTDATYDIFIIDWHLHPDDPDGFKVAEKVLSKFPDSVVLMQSADFELKNDIDSMISKDQLTCKCVYKKFLKLKKDRSNNILEIFINDKTVNIKDVGR